MMTRFFITVLFVVGLAASAFTPTVFADVTLPALFGSGMVLQRDVPIPVWGKAAPGEKITVSLGDKNTAHTEAGKEGRWQATLRAVPAGGPFTLSVSGTNRIVLSDVLVGDVWLCSGQSNMELSLQRASNAKEAIAASEDSGLRFFRVHQATPETPADDFAGSSLWQTAGPQTTGGWSAVAYFFAHALRKASKPGSPSVPIGIIGSYVGGTTGQAWTREAILQADPELMRHYVLPYPTEKAEHDRQMVDYATALVKAKAAGTKEPQKPYTFWRYSGLYNGMIAPLTRFPLRGVVWYQGESNAKDPIGYRVLLPALIHDWRVQWHAPQMPFLLVQLPPFGSPAGNGTAWAEIREIEFQAAQNIPHVGMATTTDVGTQHNIHPTDKQPVGERLALLARKMVYGETALTASGPTFRSLQITGSTARVTFDNAGDGLEARGGESSGQPVSAQTLMGFTIAGADENFVPASAKIVGKNTVEVFAPIVAQPKAVRYGFVNFPVVNLWNKNGLPASPFRSDVPGVAKPVPVPVKTKAAQ